MYFYVPILDSCTLNLITEGNMLRNIYFVSCSNYFLIFCTLATLLILFTFASRKFWLRHLAKLIKWVANDRLQGKQWVLLPLPGKTRQSSLFPVGLILVFWIVFSYIPTQKWLQKNYFFIGRLAHTFAAVSRWTTLWRESRKWSRCFPWGLVHFVYPRKLVHFDSRLATCSALQSKSLFESSIWYTYRVQEL